MRVLITILTLFALSSSAFANLKLSKNMDLCKSATHMNENRYNIPRNLLRAISLTESGRWIKEEKANIAWPWTVASGKAGEFFQTKQEAIQHVRNLQAKGVKNIDVGCMQINLRYHPTAFKNLNDAFDPVKNTAYAGDFLSRLFKETRSWTAAAGRYHSSEPTKNMYYREKVIAYWNHANQEGPQIVQPRKKAKSYKVAQIDTDRTAMLNNNFRKRMNKQRKAMTRAEKMSSQVSQWRNSGHLSSFGAVNAARNKALRMQKQKRLLTVPNEKRNSLKSYDFSQRRSAQLDKWRRTIAKPEVVAAASSRTTTPSTLLQQ